MRQLSGKWALVTGAASGIGRAISLALADAEVNLFLLDIDRERLAATEEEVRKKGVVANPLVCDLSDHVSISESVRTCLEFGHGLDILVNCAGIAHYGPMLSMSREEWERLLAVNVQAPIQLTRELLPTMLDRREAHVVNVASMLGFAAQRRWAAYCTSKFALIGFTEALRADFSREGLGITAVCPGCVDTRFFEATPCGHIGRETARPPRWILGSAETVARKTVRAIRRNRNLVLVTPMAYLIYYGKRFLPWAFHIGYNLDRPRTVRKKLARLAEKELAESSGGSA